MLVFFSEKSCPFCERAKREFLLPMQLNENYRSRVVFREIDIHSDRVLRDFDGRATSHRAFARSRQVKLVPTVLLLGPAGELIAEPMVGFNGPDFYGAYLDERIDAAVKRIRRP